MIVRRMICALIFSCSLMANAQMLKGFGDSITEAQGASDEQHTFLYLLSAKLGFGTNYKTYAHPASTVYAQGVAGFNFIDVSTQSIATDPITGYITILYGSNSDGYYVNGSDVWKANYQAIIQRFIDAGYEKNKIVLCSPPYNSLFGDGILSVTDATREIAANLGIKFADLTTYFKNYGIETLYNPGETLHPNDKGNQLMADYIYTVLQTNTSVLPVRAGSLKIKVNADGTYTATFIAAQTTNTQKFRLMYSEDGKNYKEVSVIIPEKLEMEKAYSVTFKIDNK